MEKAQVLELLHKFNNQRPGFEFANYGDVRLYNADARPVAKQRHQNIELLGYIARSESITAENLKEALTGRLELTEKGLHYTAGQYFPTEYRRALRSALVSVLWDYFRDKCECENRSEIKKAFKRNFSSSISKLI